MGALAGVIGGTTIGAAIGGGGVASYELKANGDQYPNFIAELKKEEAEEAAKKQRDKVEFDQFKKEFKEQLNGAFNGKK